MRRSRSRPMVRLSATSGRRKGGTASSTSSTPRLSARASRRRMSKCIALGDQLLAELGISGRVTLKLNTLGDAGDARGLARGARHPFPRASRRAFGGKPGAAGEESAPHPRQQGASGLADRRRRADGRRSPDARRRRLFRQGHRRARCRRRAVDPRSAAGARARLLSPHRLRVRDRGSRRAERRDRRRPL